MSDHENKNDKEQCSCCSDKASGMTEAEALATEEAWRAEMIGKYGYCVHMVLPEEDDPLPCNAHTHGVSESFGHPDLQIVCPLDKDTLCNVFASVVALIKAGAKFQDGDYSDGVLVDPYQVKFVDAEESGRHVLRVIIPDKDGNLEPFTLTDPWDVQYESLFPLPDLGPAA